MKVTEFDKNSRRLHPESTAVFLPYPARLEIIALIPGLPHGKGLARQHTVDHDAAKEGVFLHIRQQEADAVLLPREAPEAVLAVNIVDLARIIFEPAVEKALQDTDGKLAERRVETQCPFLRIAEPG